MVIFFLIRNLRHLLCGIENSLKSGNDRHPILKIITSIQRPDKSDDPLWWENNRRMYVLHQANVPSIRVKIKSFDFISHRHRE